ncbi:unnamed protein product [Schistosoma spindalis]|nr:unnamed protein product [Schistosoma spindale]
MSLQDNCGVQEVRTSHRGDCFLLLPSGERVLVKYMNGLQILGFSFAFFGLASAFLGRLHLYLTITGLLDSVLIPSLSPNGSNNYPVEFSLASGYGLPIYTGVLVSILSQEIICRSCPLERWPYAPLLACVTLQ